MTHTLVKLVMASLFFAFPQVVTGEEALIVHSDAADYNGNSCLLTGHVTIEHGLGTVTANQMKMIPAENGSGLKLGRLHLLENVVFNLKEGGQLRCAHANVDCQSLCGIFMGDPQNPMVTYIDNEEGNEQKKELVVKGRQMEMAYGKGSDGKQALEGSIRQIAVEGNVMIQYGEEFTAYGDRAAYNRHLPGTNDLKSSFPGMITLNSATAKGCVVKTLRGDQIVAKEIIIDTNLRQLEFTHPQGSLMGNSKQSEPLYFTANRLLWNEATNALLLFGGIKVRHGTLGNLNAVEKIEISQYIDRDERKLRSVESLGKATLSYANENKNIDHSLTSYGTIKIDHLKMEAWMFSPKNEEGRVPEEMQIHFDDVKGEIFADKAFIKYQVVEGDVVPSKIILGGNVRILNTLMRHEDGKVTALQYALADQVEYNPQSLEMFFKSNPGRRVLFFDKANNLQVSAPTLKIVRGSETKKETVQGYGDVRFSFIEQEFEQLRKRFAFDKTNSPIQALK